VGDFVEDEIESCLLDYLKSAQAAERPMLVDIFLALQKQHQQVRIAFSSKHHTCPHHLFSRASHAVCFRSFPTGSAL
jgi:hypothetical protein